MALIQRVYPRVPQKGYPGRLARPNAPHYIDQFSLTVPGGGTAGKPGHLLKMNSNGTVEVCDAANDDHRAIGILMPELTDVVRARLSSVPHNSPQNLEFQDGDVVNVLIDGVSWGVAGGNVNAGYSIRWDPANLNWVILGANLALNATNPSRNFISLSSGASGDLIPVYVNGFFQGIRS